MDEVTHVPAGEGEGLWVVGDTYTLKATSETTSGTLANSKDERLVPRIMVAEGARLHAGGARDG